MREFATRQKRCCWRGKPSARRWATLILAWFAALRVWFAAPQQANPQAAPTQAAPMQAAPMQATLTQQEIPLSDLSGAAFLRATRCAGRAPLYCCQKAQPATVVTETALWTQRAAESAETLLAQAQMLAVELAQVVLQAVGRGRQKEAAQQSVPVARLGLRRRGQAEQRRSPLRQTQGAAPSGSARQMCPLAEAAPAQAQGWHRATVPSRCASAPAETG